MNIFIVTPIAFPILIGILLLIIPTKWFQSKVFTRSGLILIVAFCLVMNGVLVLCSMLETNGNELPKVMFYLTKSLPIMFKIDKVSIIFASIVTIVWIVAGFFSFEYFRNDNNEKRFYGCYLILFGILIALDFSANLVTFYIFYELLTLVSVPLVLHNQTKESIMAGLKYLFYSLSGAYMVLFGFYFLNRYSKTITFSPGGILDMTLIQGHEGLLLFVAFIMILGFGVKAGMFPLHAWLPTAHPVAPTPASAVLSSIIVKAGVLGIIRVVYYLFGPDFLRGTWVQSVWLALTLITIFMGSMLAYREKVLKKRLAYSTISQVSYILFGLALLNPIGMSGALLHVVFHAFIKCGLFLIAGAIIHKTGKTKVTQLRGIGKEMPVTIWCFTILSLALIGIPPMSGFISKWYLATGALNEKIPVFSLLGPVILLISAFLTAGYLLPITIKGFLPGDDFKYETLEKKEPKKLMLVPILILTILAIVFGIMPNGLIGYINGIIVAVF
ncbi:MAG TPA: proton-conducting transporter membrane subunit [Lachnospiraceae bacterium]|nr:proton-conducting transporter membrane subunit [Lachnospiraceae bacterium]